MSFKKKLKLEEDEVIKKSETNVKESNKGTIWIGRILLLKWFIVETRRSVNATSMDKRMCECLQVSTFITWCKLIFIEK